MICDFFGTGIETGFLACNTGGCYCWFDGIAIMIFALVIIGLVLFKLQRGKTK